MLKGTVNKILLFVVMSFCVLPLSAQDDAYNAYTPESMFGIGDISKQGTAYNKSMGGVGIATRDKGHINILNPARGHGQGVKNRSWPISAWRRVTGIIPSTT